MTVAVDNVVRPFDEPPHLIHPSGAIGVWFTDPAGMVVQVLQPTHATLELTAFVSRFCYAALLELRGRRRERFSFLHDLTLLTGYDVEARHNMTMWGMEIRNQVEKVIVVLSPKSVDAVRFGVEGSASALATRGVRFEIVSSIQEAIEQAALRPQARGRRRTNPRS